MSSESKAVSERDASLANTGKCAMDSIREMVAALECDYDRLEELRDELQDAFSSESDSNDPDDTGAFIAWVKNAEDDIDHTLNDAAEEYLGLVSDAGDHEDRESAEQHVLEDALSVEYRSGWVTDKSEMIAEEYCILLSTGGPATRIVGDLDEHGEATSARLQVQDWGTPWTEHFVDSSDREALLTYARCFCMEE